MSKNCPFYTKNLDSINIPSVPTTVGVDIPSVPTGYSGIKHSMGGTTASQDSTFSKQKIYQVSPPHIQNTLEIQKQHSNYDFNSGTRRCFNVYNAYQNGRVCSNIGTDGILYTDEKPSGIVNGNADWVRGNRFGVYYDDSVINNRKKYVQRSPVIVQSEIEYVNPDPFYPIPDKDKQDSCWNKRYPHNKETKFPTWTYPYKLVNRTLTIENFENEDMNRSFYVLIALTYLYMYFISI